MYCSDYYAEEIAAEQSGQSTATFNYTQAYVGGDGPGKSRWICPNLAEITITDNSCLTVFVETCVKAKMQDPNFEPDIKCSPEILTNKTMSNASIILERQLVNTNFVPSTYHTSQQLQQYVVYNDYPLKYDQTQYLTTNLEESINTFKDNFFSSSQSETIVAAKFTGDSSSTI